MFRPLFVHLYYHIILTDTISIACITAGVLLYFFYEGNPSIHPISLTVVR